MLQIVYELTPKSDSGLRDVVAKTINQHRNLMKDSEIENMLEELNGLAVGLLKEQPAGRSMGPLAWIKHVNFSSSALNLLLAIPVIISEPSRNSSEISELWQ